MEESKSDKPKNFREQVDRMLEKLIIRAEEEVPEYGGFAPVTELFPNLHSGSSHIVGMYGMTILKFPENVDPDPKQRYVEACAYEPTGSYKAKMLVAGGHKEIILSKLKDRKFVDDLYYTYGELVDCLKD